jgi:hypothetical protein
MVQVPIALAWEPARRRETSMKTRLACGLVFALFVVGCSSDTVDEAGSASDDAGTAGRVASGGKTSVGGKSGSGGRTYATAGSTGTPRAGQAGLVGTEDFGGMPGVAGSTSAAGAAVNGGATVTNGGATVTNGGVAPSVAGATSIAGTSSVVTAGGNVSTGGVASVSGAPATGGINATGGIVAVAGAHATGGTPLTAGGASAAAGASSAATGGATLAGAGTTGVGGIAATGGSVTVAGAPSAGGACATTYYRDADNDTWGSAESSCTAGAGWVTRTGDCNDANADVHPEQGETFAEPYTAANGTASFDYNCDGTETRANGTQVSDGACASSGMGNSCVGDGYLSVEPARIGTDLNQLCGSTRYLVCARSQQVCVGAISTDGTHEAVRCR